MIDYNNVILIRNLEKMLKAVETARNEALRDPATAAKWQAEVDAINERLIARGLET